MKEREKGEDSGIGSGAKSRGKSLAGALKSSVRERLHVKQSIDNMLNNLQAHPCSSTSADIHHSCTQAHVPWFVRLEETTIDVSGRRNWFSDRRGRIHFHMGNIYTFTGLPKQIQ